MCINPPYVWTMCRTLHVPILLLHRDILARTQWSTSQVFLHTFPPLHAAWKLVELLPKRVLSFRCGCFDQQWGSDVVLGFL